MVSVSILEFYNFMNRLSFAIILMVLFSVSTGAHGNETAEPEAAAAEASATSQDNASSEDAESDVTSARAKVSFPSADLNNDEFNTTLELAREGNPEAMYVIALRLLEEDDAELNMNAFGWALNAARAGHPASAELTGKLYRLGIGVDQNFVKGRKWLYRALSRNAIGAHFELALLFSDEANPSYNPEQAAKHMADAISKNEPRACLVAANNKIMNGRPIRYALKELTCAANGGISSAMVTIAEYYLNKRSPNAVFYAKQWLNRAADAGNDKAVQLLNEIN